MTAEIAILNTYGVSLAADSAVTLSVGNSEKKIYNSANKVFTLSKYEPVGIMVYSNAKFMDIEWEIVIKEFRKRLGKKVFNTLYEYANEFIEYLRTIEYVNQEQKDECYTILVMNSVVKIKNSFLAEAKEEIEKLGKVEESKLNDVLEGVLNKIINIQNQVEDNPVFCLNNEYFTSKRSIFDRILKIVFENFEINEKCKELAFEVTKSYVKKNSNFPSFSGIVIAGYGEKEIFPSIYTCHIYGIVDNCLIRTKEERNSISIKNRAVIMPFAQSEMVNSFMEGIDPVFEQVISKQISILFEKFNDLLKDGYIDKANQVKDTFNKILSDFKRKTYIDPILSIVGSLQKSDLAEMSEALVNLTSFKRHVSAEAETVGGPTDVAIITKGDGFIWIKRKHYFNPDLNTQFFENYFREGEKNE